MSDTPSPIRWSPGNPFAKRLRQRRRELRALGGLHAAPSIDDPNQVRFHREEEHVAIARMQAEAADLKPSDVLDCW